MPNMSREQWLQTLKVGSIVVECTPAEQKTVQVSEIKKGRIWYHNVYTMTGGMRCVSAATGYSHDMKTHILPQDSEEPDDDVLDRHSVDAA